MYIRVRITLIIKRCRDAAHAGCHIIDYFINLCCVHTLVDMFSYVVEHCDIYLGALLDSRYLVRCLDD